MDWLPSFPNIQSLGTECWNVLGGGTRDEMTYCANAIFYLHKNKTNCFPSLEEMIIPMSRADNLPLLYLVGLPIRLRHLTLICPRHQTSIRIEIVFSYHASTLSTFQFFWYGVECLDFLRSARWELPRMPALTTVVLVTDKLFGKQRRPRRDKESRPLPPCGHIDKQRCGRYCKVKLADVLRLRPVLEVYVSHQKDLPAFGRFWPFPAQNGFDRRVCHCIGYPNPISQNMNSKFELFLSTFFSRPGLTKLTF
jgi:hypothetical protein